MSEQKRNKLLKQSIRRSLFHLRKINYSSEWGGEWVAFHEDAGSNYHMELSFRRTLVTWGRDDYKKHYSKSELRG